jgi:hypothetical protein
MHRSTAYHARMRAVFQNMTTHFETCWHKMLHKSSHTSQRWIRAPCKVEKLVISRKLAYRAWPTRALCRSGARAACVRAPCVSGACTPRGFSRVRRAPRASARGLSRFRRASRACTAGAPRAFGISEARGLSLAGRATRACTGSGGRRRHLPLELLLGEQHVIHRALRRVLEKLLDQDETGKRNHHAHEADKIDLLLVRRTRMARLIGYLVRLR